MATIRSNTNVKITGKTLTAAVQGVTAIAQSEILVGVPEEKTDRPDEEITNAALAYIHDNGSPEEGIPQREFMRPGIKDAETDIERYLSGGMRAALRGNIVAAEGQMHGAGLTAQSAIRNKIDEGIPPPIADATLRARLAKHKGRKGEKLELDRRARGLDPSMVLAVPLIDTGEMRKSIAYVIRKRSQRRAQ